MGSFSCVGAETFEFRMCICQTAKLLNIFSVLIDNALCCKVQAYCFPMRVFKTPTNVAVHFTGDLVTA